VKRTRTFAANISKISIHFALISWLLLALDQEDLISSYKAISPSSCDSLSCPYSRPLLIKEIPVKYFELLTFLLLNLSSAIQHNLHYYRLAPPSSNLARSKPHSLILLNQRCFFELRRQLIASIVCKDQRSAY